MIDDDPFNCLAIKELFKVVGFDNADERVDTCYGGREALKKIRSSISFGTTSYGLILTDCQMPEVDGYELTRRALDMFNDEHVKGDQVPEIMAITGHVEAQYIERAFAAGMTNVYSKPF